MIHFMLHADRFDPPKGFALQSPLFIAPLGLDPFKAAQIGGVIRKTHTAFAAQAFRPLRQDLRIYKHPSLGTFNPGGDIHDCDAKRNPDLRRSDTDAMGLAAHDFVHFLNQPEKGGIKLSDLMRRLSQHRVREKSDEGFQDTSLEFNAFDRFKLNIHANFLSGRS